MAVRHNFDNIDLVHESTCMQGKRVGWYKLNTDAAVENMKKRRGLGIAIRNEKGELMGAMATPAYSRFVLSFGL